MATDNWGVTDAGFYCPVYDEVLASKISSAKELFGEDICTDNNTALGKFIRIEATYDHKLFEELEKLYYSVSPTTATGVSLDRAVSFAGIQRNTAVAAEHKIRLWGTAGYTKPKGSLVRSVGGVVFYLAKDCVISECDTSQNDVERYYGDVVVKCVDAGAKGNVYNINQLVTYDTNIDAVTYIESVIDGADTETDTELRNRYNNVVNGLGTNTKNAIIAELLKINGVHNVIIIENTSEGDITISDKYELDEEGNPTVVLTIQSGKYAIIVNAGRGLDLRQKIAKAIFSRQPFGVMQNGCEKEPVKDDAGEYHDVLFTYVEEKLVNVSIKCSVNNSFEASGVDDIKNNVEAYINALGIGNPLIYSKLYQQIYAVDGTTDITALTADIATSEDNGNTSSIYPNEIQILRCGDISVTVTKE